MEHKVVLVSMPFFSSRIPSIQIAILRKSIEIYAPQISVDERHYYLEWVNFLAQHYFGYDTTVDMMEEIDLKTGYYLLGEWIFAGALNGIEYGQENYLEYIDSLKLPNDYIKVDRISSEQLKILRSAAIVFIDNCVKDIIEQYDIVCFSSCYMQNVASLALAKKN